MAAPSNNPSPTNRPLDDSKATDADAPAAKADDVAVAENNTAAVTESPPTYESVEASDVFLLAKQHLADGKFEDGMTVIEEAIRDTQEVLKRLSGNPNEDFSCHESLAPLHYMYGTTLLYQIEESDQEVTTAGSAVSTAVVSGEQAAAASPAEDDDGPTIRANDYDNDNQDNQMASAEDMAEDMEIAWENFEAARAITEEFLVSNTNNELTDKLELDLAQIHLREGDLQRMNGRNENAIQDYQSCLRLRKKSKFLGTFDRKIADVHYNLAMVYMNLASKDDEANSENEQSSNTAFAKASKAEDDAKVKEAKHLEALHKSMYHYLECSKCFCGQIASICNADPKTFTAVAKDDADNVASLKGEGKDVPQYKTTGQEDEEMEDPKVASSKLQTLRNRVDALVSSSSASFNEEQNADVVDLCQLLEEIQETVDEAESATKGVQEVTNMKAEVAALAAADGEPGTDSKTGGTTTIGFGSASPTKGVAVAAAAASASTAATAASPARPMMVIKKKKRAVVQPVQQPDVKKAKPESE